MSERDERDDLAQAIYPLAFDSPIEDRATKILRGDAYRIADSVLAAGYRKHPEPQVSEEMVDLIQDRLYDDAREGDRAPIREALEAVFRMRIEEERG